MNLATEDSCNAFSGDTTPFTATMVATIKNGPRGCAGPLRETAYGCCVNNPGSTNDLYSCFNSSMMQYANLQPQELNVFSSHKKCYKESKLK